MKKILFALTSHADLGGLRETGYYVPEAAHPYTQFKARGYDAEFVSPLGGQPPMDGFNPDDAEQVAFLADNSSKLERTFTAEEVNPLGYDAVFFVGGHGTMWDFADNAGLAQIAAQIYDRGGVVAAVCHGPAGLVNVRLSSGEYLVAGKAVAAFTNAEEIAVGLQDNVPFMLETVLTQRGAQHVAAPNFNENVQVSERLVTGQNPASARGVGAAVVALLESSTVADSLEQRAM